MAQKKYASLSTLSTLVDNIKNLFATKSDLNTGLSGKADKSHKHSISDTTNLQSTLDGKVPTTRTINNKPLSANITLSASDVGAAPSSVQTNLNTVSDTLNAHTENDDIHFTATERTKLSGIQSGAQVNTITGVKGNSESTYRTGNVNITKANIGLGNVDNTSDINKPISTAQQLAFDEINDAIDTHTENDDIHVTTTNKTNWNAAHTHSTSAHARTDATKVEDSSTNGNIKINGTETNVYSHPTSGVNAGTYKSVTVNAQGHVTGGSNPTTLSGFGITDGALKSDVTNHNTSTTAHNDIRDLITGLTNRLNTLADSDDTTLDQMSEIVTYIKANKSLIDSITTNKVNVADIINNLTTNVTNKPLSAAQGVEIKRLIDALQSSLNTHTADTTKHITSTERTDWNNAKTLAENALPTSGGTMTGGIEMGQSNLAKQSIDTSSVSIYGGTGSSNGASIIAYGKEQTLYPGYFVLKANNGETSSTLEGRPDGTLRWKGKNVVALGTSDVIPISNGGTGAATASEALSNLGGMSKSSPVVTGSFSMNKLHSSTIGSCSFVEGYNCSATGSYGAHAEGYYTEANGNRSHAEGDGAVANGLGSHAEGQKTIATCDYQHAQGKYNIEDTNKTYAHIVGNGTSNSKRSNAHTIDWNGNAWFKGNIYVGGTSQTSGATMLSSIATVTQAEYTALEEAEATNANTLYMLTDAEEEVVPQIQIITLEEND